MKLFLQTIVCGADTIPTGGIPGIGGPGGGIGGGKTPTGRQEQDVRGTYI